MLNCAALLRAGGHEVSLRDERADPAALRDVNHSAYDTCLMTLSPLDRWQCPNTDLQRVDAVVQQFPRDRLILMGAQATVRPELILSRTGVSGVILGEPEGGIRRLVEGARCGDLAGTARLDGDELVRGPEPSPVDIAALPVPAWDLIDFRRYRYEVLGSHMGLLELTRGCPWRCRFCLLTMYGKKYRRKRPEQLVAEIGAAVGHGMRCAYFQDLEFTLDHELVRSLCDALLASGTRLRWACQTRPDTVDRSLLRHMRAAGCELIHYGVESGAERVVQLTDKRQSLAAVQAGVRAARSVGMRTLCYFLIGLPSETPSEMAETLAFAQRVRPTYASFQVATPYPGTPFHADEGPFEDAFPAVFPGALSEPELQATARALTLKYHLGPRYLFTRMAGPGRRAAVREAGLLARYFMTGP